VSLRKRRGVAARTLVTRQTRVSGLAEDASLGLDLN